MTPPTSAPNNQELIRRELNDGWTWARSPKPPLTTPHHIIESVRGDDSDVEVDWTPCTCFPSEIHRELLAVGQIPDPFKGLNEEVVQWVGETDWLYRTVIHLSKKESTQPCVDLVIEGLDTIATVFFDGEEVLKSDNMFQSHRISLKGLKGDIEVIIVFSSAFLMGKRREASSLGEGNHLPAWNGDPSRLYVRKAQYHYGWDWGPKIMTTGPWKPISVDAYVARIDSFWPQAEVDETLNGSLFIPPITIAASQDIELSIEICLLDPYGEIVYREETEPGRAVTWTVSKDQIHLWWSVGLGEPSLYTIFVTLYGWPGGASLHRVSHLIGFRRLRVVQEPLQGEPGASFCFEINNVRLFCGGSNWIPIDSFLTTATRQRYREWLELLVEGNQNMVRVWGGGLYESDDFYELCDEMGILVWQDFLFACGAYPAHEAFVASVRVEAEQQVERLRHHPCLAIFAGNNEDYQLAESEGLEYDPEDHNGDWSKTTFPARTIYERVLPEVVKRLSDVHYHPGSPWGGMSTTDPTIGDTHQWNVWHGTQEPYQNWDKLASRFVSEFGMQGYPDLRTIDYFLDGELSERFPQSRTIGYHNKAAGFERRQALYLVENIRFTFDLEGYAYATQLVQAEALSSAYRVWRRNFQGPGREFTAGALVWQLNDVYPCTSWSIVDYFLRPKPAYYAIKRALAPISVTIKRDTERKAAPGAPKHSARTLVTHLLDVFAFNSSLKSRRVTLWLEGFALSTGERAYQHKQDSELGPNRSTELLKRVVLPDTPHEGDAVIISARLLDVDDHTVLARFASWPEPYKSLTFPSAKDTKLQVDLSDWPRSIKVRAARPVKGLIFTCDKDVSLSDNAIDLIPGDDQVIGVKTKFSKPKLSWRHLAGV